MWESWHDADVNLADLMTLTPHGIDIFVGEGHRYPWGGLFGGHIVAQALRAGAHTVDADLAVHSIRAYFIRRGDHTEPVRYAVDRIRNGRSFATRRVVARQSVGAILTLEASFQRGEDGPDRPLVTMPPGLPQPDDLAPSAWGDGFDRRLIPAEVVDRSGPQGLGRCMAWMRATGDIGDDPLVHRCIVAYLSDDLPTDSVFRVHPEVAPRLATSPSDLGVYSASLDHAVWFHRPLRADTWHLYDMVCTTLIGTRGLTWGTVFDAEGAQVATVAQEVLIRDARAARQPL
jgi:acyl-CoA thioesterase II